MLMSSGRGYLELAPFWKAKGILLRYIHAQLVVCFGGVEVLPSAQHSSVPAGGHCVPKPVLYVTTEAVTVLDPAISGMNIGSFRVARFPLCVCSVQCLEG